VDPISGTNIASIIIRTFVSHIVLICMYREDLKGWRTWKVAMDKPWEAIVMLLNVIIILRLCTYGFCRC
jgi:hypothetical protein